MDMTAIGSIIAVALIAIALFVYWKSKGRITPQELATAAQMAVMAAEQARTTGKLNSNEEQLQYAIDFIQQVLPATRAVPDKIVIDAIESFVPAANAFTASIIGAWQTNDAPQPPAPPPASPTLGNMG